MCNPYFFPFTLNNDSNNDVEAMTQCSMAAKAWFKFGNTRETVSLEGIEYVDDLREAIKLKMTPKLDERTS